MLEDIVLNVVDLMINSLEAKLEERIMNTLISFVGKAMQPSFGYWDEQIVIAILAFLQWLSYFIFSCSMLVLIADIAEENSSLRSGQFKTIEWPTIFINVLKAIAFIEIAPIAGRLSLELGGRLLWRMDVSGMLQGAVDISRIKTARKQSFSIWQRGFGRRLHLDAGRSFLTWMSCICSLKINLWFVGFAPV